ncbi:MAG TPA: protein-glutamate O-methyltransferase CheR [Acidobacteriaceae bacterium]|jgi:chemotaxis protein methyltransferase CheR|nr:protein-glutamate O-methyltransferase CheR [Acidobacteriaceae bacterium]
MTLSVADAEYLRGVVQRTSGNHIDSTREYLFESRLQRVLQSRGLSSLEQLVAALRRETGTALQRTVAEAMTINETSFFRDSATFELLRTELLPSLIAARQQTRTLRLWSAASSSGQEAYSLAILLREHFPLLAGWRIDILGTDISSEMVERSSAGRYQRIEINRGLPARLLLKYMVRTGDEWEVAPEIKRLCRFQQRNLCDLTLVAGRFDIIFLRNVMIYFPQDTRQRVLTTVHRSLEPDGHLFLGMGEQTRMESHWQAVLAPKTVWYKPLGCAFSTSPGGGDILSSRDGR